MAQWNPQTYLKFGQERLRPALDLLAQIPLEQPQTLVDLGCGPGNVTALLKQKWPHAHVTGIDSSPDMLNQARENHPDIDWVETDIATWQPDQKIDLIFSNACLHWLGNHDILFPKLLDHLNEGGILAVQMPNNFAAPTHQAIRDILGEDHPLCPGYPVSECCDYYQWLAPKCERLDIWETTYTHVLSGDNPVADWTKGAALRPVLDGIKDKGEKQAFEQTYRDHISQAYPTLSNGKTLLPFKRLFMVCLKK
ncbi:MAG: methyltransferase domain-containing protein [Terasakiella sp.]|uniref:methyltransferase domain-containing protein n=1 Tax=unclassified Terasakiella TaxID=2614952 RepID=UPI003B003A38